MNKLIELKWFGPDNKEYITYLDYDSWVKSYNWLKNPYVKHQKSKDRSSNTGAK